MKSNIDGVDFFKSKEIPDDRGAVLHMIRSDSIGFNSFGECYFSEIYSGKIKAWKKHNVQTQNITVPIGEIILVLYDKRKKSKTFNNKIVCKIGRPKNYLRVKIPPGIWYGFKCISSISSLIVNCTDIPHDKLESETLNFNSNFIPHNWKEY